MFKMISPVSGVLMAHSPPDSPGALERLDVDTMRMLGFLGSFFSIAFASFSGGCQATRVPTLETQRSVPTAEAAFLIRAIDTWDKEQVCASCHHHGDAARVLSELGLFDRLSTTFTREWLQNPLQWADPQDGAPFHDEQLAKIQFAWSLNAAIASGALEDDSSLSIAANGLLQDQKDDGSFSPHEMRAIGSPVTYGAVLATVAARQVLQSTRDRVFESALEKAESFLLAYHPKNVLDAAAILISQVPTIHRTTCLRILTDGQSLDGGWGPFLHSPPEVFDTALALIALAPLRIEDPLNDAVIRGRRFLLERQLDDGSWEETTRPTLYESYAQRVSTTAWAALALARTR